jgi:phage shock protein PspC (stress-responsive transcriptional regulator)
MGAGARARHADAMTENATDPQTVQQHDHEEDTAADRPRARQMQRPVEGRMVAGVAAAAADYLDIDVNIIRIVIATLTLFGGAGVGLYLAGWLLIPEEGENQSIAADFLGSIGSH